MKKIMLIGLLAFIVNVISAQSQPQNYDGGNDLRSAILKAKSKENGSKTKRKPSKGKSIYKVTSGNPQSAEEKLYYDTHGYSSTAEITRVTSSPEYKRQLLEAERAETEHIQKRKNEAAQRKLDSISKAEELAIKNKQRDEKAAKFQRRVDSLEAKRKQEHDAYYEEQRRQQKKNR